MDEFKCLAIVKYISFEDGDSVVAEIFHGETIDDVCGKVNDLIRYDRRKGMVAEEYYRRNENGYERV